MNASSLVQESSTSATPRATKTWGMGTTWNSWPRYCPWNWRTCTRSRRIQGSCPYPRSTAGPACRPGPRRPLSFDTGQQL